VTLQLITLFGPFLILLSLRVPIFMAMGLACAGYGVAYPGAFPGAQIAQSFGQGLDNYDFAAIPFFFLAGAIMNAGGMTQRMLAVARALVGRVRGGLSHVNILTSMVFAGVSGSAVADASAVGSVLIPAMKKDGYPSSYAAAVTAMSATIGPVIPPSIPLVIFALLASVSVGDLFLAGIVPGLLMGLFLLVASFVISYRRGYPATGWLGWRALGRSTLEAAAALLLPVVVVVGLVGGIATTTEIGAIACVYAGVISMFLYRDLPLARLWQTIGDAALDSGNILVIISVTGAFTYIIASMGLAAALGEAIRALSSDPIVVLAIIAVTLVLLGTILEPVTLMIVIIPVFLPVAQSVGIDMVQMGVVVVLATLIGLVTPPVGVLLYLTAAQAGASPTAVVRESALFLLALLAVLGVLIVWPAATSGVARLF